MVKDSTLPKKSSVDLSARPRQLPVAGAQMQKDGTLRVVTLCDPPRWLRWLTRRRKVQRVFLLDNYGQQVLAACDGQHTISRIAQDFAHANGLSLPQAEAAVAQFLQTLESRKIITLMPRQ